MNNCLGVTYFVSAKITRHRARIIAQSNDIFALKDYRKDNDYERSRTTPPGQTPQSKIFVFHFLKIFMVSQVHNLLIVQWLPV